MKCRWAVILAVEAAAAAAAGNALAHGPDDERVFGPPSAAPSTVPTSPEAPVALGGGGRDQTSDRGRIDVDLALGWGRVPFAVQNLPTTGTQAITYSRGDEPSDVQSFVVGGSVVLAKNVDIGARVPLTFGTISPGVSAARSATAFGNVELVGRYARPIGDTLEADADLGVALPTAQGQVIPADLSGVDSHLVDFGAYDRFSISRGAAAARGFEDNELFAPMRVGIVPKLAFGYRGANWAIEPYVKVVNLIGTSSSLEAPYVSAVVPALRVAFRAPHPLELAVRGWAAVGFAGTDEDRRTTAAIEPDVALASGILRAYGGVLVPLAGPPEQAGFLAARFGLSGVF
jgi:hypothetical protein